MSVRGRGRLRELLQAQAERRRPPGRRLRVGGAPRGHAPSGHRGATRGAAGLRPPARSRNRSPAPGRVQWPAATARTAGPLAAAPPRAAPRPAPPRSRHSALGRAHQSPRAPGAPSCDGRGLRGAPPPRASSRGYSRSRPERAALRPRRDVEGGAPAGKAGGLAALGGRRWASARAGDALGRPVVARPLSVPARGPPASPRRPAPPAAADAALALSGLFLARASRAGGCPPGGSSRGAPAGRGGAGRGGTREGGASAGRRFLEWGWGTVSCQNFEWHKGEFLEAVKYQVAPWVVEHGQPGCWRVARACSGTSLLGS